MKLISNTILKQILQKW